MWNDIFDTVLTLSWQAGLIALAVMALRPLLKRAPRWSVCLLWALVAVRLLLPVSLTVESPVSLQPAEAPTTQVYHELQQRENAYLYTQPEQRTEEMQHQYNSTAPSRYLPVFWLMGLGGMLLYLTLSTARMMVKLHRAPRLFDNVYRCDAYGTAFVMGLFYPCIYVPSTVTEEDLPQILAHERCHIKRGDHIVKVLAFLLLALHWFNPVMWAAYILLGRDMECACDELVLKDADNAGRAAYSRALVSCAAASRITAVCPLAFGEVAVKERVKAVLSGKKTARWGLALAVLAAAAVCVLLLTKPSYGNVGTLNAETLYALRTETVKDEAAVEDILEALGITKLLEGDITLSTQELPDDHTMLMLVCTYPDNVVPVHNDAWYRAMTVRSYTALALMDDVDTLGWWEPSGTDLAVLGRDDESFSVHHMLVHGQQFPEEMAAARQSPEGLAALIDVVKREVKEDWLLMGRTLDAEALRDVIQNIRTNAAGAQQGTSQTAQEYTTWPSMQENDPVSVDPKDYGIDYSAELPDWETVPLSWLCACYLGGDGAYADGALYELAQRWRWAPNTFDAYMDRLSQQGYSKEAGTLEQEAIHYARTELPPMTMVFERDGLQVEVAGVRYTSVSPTVYGTAAVSVKEYILAPGATLSVWDAAAETGTNGTQQGAWKLYCSDGTATELLPGMEAVSLKGAEGIGDARGYVLRFFTQQ